MGKRHEHSLQARAKESHCQVPVLPLDSDLFRAVDSIALAAIETRIPGEDGTHYSHTMETPWLF
jgi:hypothetical protein